jgi:6-phosphofructokinase 1
MVIRRIAITLGGGYLPGLSGVVRACARAARGQGWDVLGIRDGFDGLLCPERYAQGGLVPVEGDGNDDEGSLLGTGTRNDPFRVQLANADGFVEQHDASGRVLESLRAAGVDALIAIVGGSAVTGSHALSVMWKFARLGLPCVCIPKSSENDLAATTQPFGYDSVREFAAHCLRHARIAARDQGRVAVVEVPGQYAGWLALDAGLAAGADVILIPELPYDADAVARHLDGHPESALVVVAEGARARGETSDAYGDNNLARAGRVARQVHEAVQRRCGRELFPLVLDQWVRAGAVTAADRSLGGAYGAEAVRLLAEGHCRHLLAANAGRFEAVPLGDAFNGVRTVDGAAPVLRSARDLGISLGEGA